MNMKETIKKSSESPPPSSFSSLPYDVVLNILARISRIHRPTLSLVSKSFQSLIASRELDDTRTLIGKTEDCIYVCLDLNKKNPNSRWFALAPIPQRQKLLPIPLCTYEHPKHSSTVISIGSEIYIIGGSLEGRRCRTVLVLDCQFHQWRRFPDSRSHQWRRLPDMIVPRFRPAAEVIDGKIYVIGGCVNEHDNMEHWGEVYDPKTQTWETFSPETLDLTTQKSVVPGRLVMGGKVYVMFGLELNLRVIRVNICLVEIDKNVLCQISVSTGCCLIWRDANELEYWRSVTGLEGLYLSRKKILVANSCRGRVTVLWEREVFSSERRYSTTEIWCAEISFERRGVKEVRGVVEWSNSVFTVDGWDCDRDFFLDSAIITQ